MRLQKILAYAAIYILWGGSFLAIREIVTVTPPFFSAGARFLPAGLLLVLYAQAQGGVVLSRRQWLGAALLGLVMFAGDYSCLFWAEQRLSSGIAAVIFAIIPVWIFIGEVMILRTQRMTPQSLGGVILGFVGVVALAWQSAERGPDASVAPVVVSIAGTLCWSVGTLLSRKLALPTPQTANAGWQMGVGGALLLALSVAAGESHRVPAALAAWSPKVMVSMAYLIVAASILSFTAYVWLLRHEPISRVASYAYVNPVVALVIGAVLGGERLTILQVAGSVLVIGGVFATLTGKQAAPMDAAKAVV